TNQGFDSYFGLPYSNDMSIAKEIALSDDLKLDPRWTRKRLERDLKVYETDYRSMKDIMPLMRGEEIIEYPTDQSQLTKRYTHEAVRFIERNKEKPFFLYLPHTMPHTPIFVDERFKDSSGVSLYCDSIQEIDWSVGRVLNSLRENNLAEKTLVLFCSDNGPANREDKPGGSSAGPFRGHKFDTFEGGHRVSCIVWAPGLIEEGTESDAITSTLDLFPTIAHLAGIPLPTDRVYDSYNLAPLLTGQTDTSPRKEMFFYRANSTELDGVRIGDWKFLHRGSHRNRDKKPASPMLFHLSTDPGEQTNLAEENPEKVEELLARMKAFDEAITTE
ncbi:MAG: sulfatase-like hydrolase/transferase, partial [Verrucomicrobiota bacterium]